MPPGAQRDMERLAEHRGKQLAGRTATPYQKQDRQEPEVLEGLLAIAYNLLVTLCIPLTICTSISTSKDAVTDTSRCSLLRARYPPRSVTPCQFSLPRAPRLAPNPDFKRCERKFHNSRDAVRLLFFVNSYPLSLSLSYTLTCDTTST